MSGGTHLINKSERIRLCECFYHQPRTGAHAETERLPTLCSMLRTQGDPRHTPTQTQRCSEQRRRCRLRPHFVGPADLLSLNFPVHHDNIDTLPRDTDTPQQHQHTTPLAAWYNAGYAQNPISNEVGGKRAECVSWFFLLSSNCNRPWLSQPGITRNLTSTTTAATPTPATTPRRHHSTHMHTDTQDSQ